MHGRPFPAWGSHNKKEVKKIEKDEDEETLRKLVPKRFWKWKKVFGKRESERMPV